MAKNEDVVFMADKILNNVLFEFDKFELQKESYPELDRLAALIGKKYNNDN